MGGKIKPNKGKGGVLGLWEVMAMLLGHRSPQGGGWPLGQEGGRTEERLLHVSAEKSLVTSGPSRDSGEGGPCSRGQGGRREAECRNFTL